MDRRGMFLEKHAPPAGRSGSLGDTLFWIVFYVQSALMVASAILAIVVFAQASRVIVNVEVLAVRYLDEFSEEVLTPIGRKHAQQTADYVAKCMQETPTTVWPELLGNLSRTLEVISSANVSAITTLITNVTDDPRVPMYAYRLLSDIRQFRGLGTFAARTLSRLGGIDADPICELVFNATACQNAPRCEWSADTCVSIDLYA